MKQFFFRAVANPEYTTLLSKCQLIDLCLNHLKVLSAFAAIPQVHGFEARIRRRIASQQGLLLGRHLQRDLAVQGPTDWQEPTCLTRNATRRHIVMPYMQTHVTQGFAESSCSMGAVDLTHLA